jgi:hypothetical protein
MATQLLPRRSQPCRLSLASTLVRADWHLSGTGGRRGCQHHRCGRHGPVNLVRRDSSDMGHRLASAASDFACCLAARWRQAWRAAWSSDSLPCPSHARCRPAMGPRRQFRESAWSATCKYVRGAPERPDAMRLATATRISRSAGPCGAPPTSRAKTCVVLEADSGSQRSLCRAVRSCVGTSYAATSDDSPTGSDLRFGGRGGTRTPDCCLVRTPRTPLPGDIWDTPHQLALNKTPRAATTLAKCWQALQSARHARVAECPASTGSQVGCGYGSFPPHHRRRLDNREGRPRHQWAILGDVGNASSLGASPPPQARRHRVCRPGRQACCSAGVR